MCHFSNEICENRLRSFLGASPLTNKQTNERTNADENITFLADVARENKQHKKPKKNKLAAMMNAPKAQK